MNKYEVLKENSDNSSVLVNIPDKKLLSAINKRLFKGEDEPITKEELKLLKTLDISFINITNLEGLEYAINLEELRLYNNCNLFNISQVSHLKNLNSLELEAVSIKDLDTLSKLENLEYLRVDYCDNLIDISGINNLLNLRYLTINNDSEVGNSINYNSITNLPNLEEFILNDFNIKNIKFLNNFKTLKKAILNNAHLINSNEFANLDNSTQFNACINKLNILSKTDNIANIILKSNNIKNISTSA